MSDSDTLERPAAAHANRTSGSTAPLTPDVLVYNLVVPSDPRISPDGSRVLYTLHDADHTTRRSRSQVWTCGIDGTGPRVLTPTHERAGNARWSPDGRQIAYTVAAVPDGSGIVVAPVAAEERPREITRHVHPIDNLVWSPDGRSIAYTTVWDPEEPDEQGSTFMVAPRVRVTRRLDYKQDGRGFVGDARKHVFVVDVATNGRRRLTRELVDHTVLAWSPDGRWLLVLAPRSSEATAPRLHATSLLLLDPVTGTRRALSPPDCSVEQAAWSPAGDRIVFTADVVPRSFQSDFYLHDLTTNTTRRLTEDLASSLSGLSPAPPIWLDERRVLFHGVGRGASGLEVLDTETGSVEVVGRWPCRASGLSADQARRYVVQVQSTLTAPPEVWVYDLEEGNGRTITTHNTRLLEAHPPAQWERLEVPRGELTIDAWLLKPPDFDPTKRYPLVLDIHGGPAANYGYGFTDQQQQQHLLATNGFLVVFANPRGSTSYGRQFIQAVDWGGEDFRDCLAAVDAVLERPYSDPERTGIFGYSYGGYLCAWAITQTDRFKAAVCGSMFFDLESAYGTADNRGIAVHAGGRPHERPEWYAAHSPSTFAHRARTPTLLIHGEEDHRITVGQAEQMFVALKDAGCEVELVRYPGASHMFIFFGHPEHRVDYLSRVLGWFREHLCGPI